jgi:flagellar basal-body rod protein FlgB
LLEPNGMSSIYLSVDRLERAMTFHRERHAVLAGNVANVDTPGYKPMDLAQVDAADAPGQLATTDARHLAGPGETAAGHRSFKDAGALQTADGNAVNLERELAKVDANRIRYATSGELVSRRLALLRYAAGDGTQG